MVESFFTYAQLGLSELQSWDPALPDDVIHLLSDGGVIQWGQEGEGLEEPACGAHSISPTQFSAACLQAVSKC